MSGRINGKDKSKGFDEQKTFLSMKSAATAPPLPSRANVKSAPSCPAPRLLVCQKCNTSGATCGHQYDEVSMNRRDSQEQNHYERLMSTDNVDCGNKIDGRLRNIEDNQMRLRNEFNDFRESTQHSIKSLHTSIQRLIEMSESLDESMRESFAFVQSNMDKSQQKFLESVDHLGKQIIDVRRDIVMISKNQLPIVRHDMERQTRKKNTNVLEWEVGNIDKMITLQQTATSQSLLLGQLDYKVIGEAVCTRDGRLQVKITGNFTHMSTNHSDKKNTNFECIACIIDKSGNQANLLVGKVAGDFTKGKEWLIGEVSVAELQGGGYIGHRGTVHMKYVIDIWV